MNIEKRNNLLRALSSRPSFQDDQLHKEKIKGQNISIKKDWLWHQLLSAMSTMGNSRGYTGLMEDLENYNSVSYYSLSQHSEINKISEALLNALSKAKARRPQSKATWLTNNWKMILDCGGLEAMQSFILNTHGREIKIKLMRLFDGIGEKYARNIFMEMYHPDFINSIAIDERILDISEALEIDKSKLKYIDHENKFIGIAEEGQISPWELDRFLYFFKPYYLKSIKNGV